MLRGGLVLLNFVLEEALDLVDIFKYGRILLRVLKNRAVRKSLRVQIVLLGVDPHHLFV